MRLLCLHVLLFSWASSSSFAFVRMCCVLYSLCVCVCLPVAPCRLSSVVVLLSLSRIIVCVVRSVCRCSRFVAFLVDVSALVFLVVLVRVSSVVSSSSFVVHACSFEGCSCSWCVFVFLYYVGGAVVMLYAPFLLGPPSSVLLYSGVVIRFSLCASGRSYVLASVDLLRSCIGLLVVLQWSL